MGSISINYFNIDCLYWYYNTYISFRISYYSRYFNWWDNFLIASSFSHSNGNIILYKENQINGLKNSKFLSLLFRFFLQYTSPSIYKFSLFLLTTLFKILFNMIFPVFMYLLISSNIVNRITNNLIAKAYTSTVCIIGVS